MGTSIRFQVVLWFSIGMSGKPHEHAVMLDSTKEPTNGHPHFDRALTNRSDSDSLGRVCVCLLDLPCFHVLASGARRGPSLLDT